jgi:magnesium-transporting ATPase (P-type)
MSRLSALHTENGLVALQEQGGISGLCTSLSSDPKLGLQSSVVVPHREKYGENRIPEQPMTSYCRYIIIGLEDFTLRLLIGCALLSIVIALAFQRDEELSWLEGVAILGTVVAVLNIQAIQDWTKERSFRKMSAVSNESSVTVIRDGKRQEIVRYDIVVGDVVAIGVGDVIEADGVLLDGADVEIDESALTGEPEDKKEKRG